MAILIYVMVVTMMLGSVVSERSATERILEILEREGFKNHSSSAVTNLKRRILQDYNSDELPRSDRPTEVRLGIYIISFSGISEMNMDYSISFYLRQAWHDPRLAFEAVDGLSEITMDRYPDRLWLPDTFFRNEKKANYHTVTVRNTLSRINATGHVWHVTKITATFSSPMKLQDYPMDSQVLPLLFESFSHTMDKMYYTWLQPSATISPDVQLPQFTLNDIESHDCSQNYTSGAYPCLELRFQLDRDSGYFVMQVFIPSILLVILSWGGFWISITAMASRVTLGLLTLLVMTTQSSGVQASLPRVSYMKAIDIWIGVCLIFIMASVLEAAIVNTICQKETGGKSKMEAGDRHPKADRVDTICKIAFPVAFLLFNVIFWAVFAS